MRGDFEDGKKVKLATSGLFDHQEQRKEAHEAAPSKASKQQLAEGKLRLKAAHQALAKVAHAEAKQGQMHPMMERPMQRHFVRSREAAIRAKYPTEDRFVARYTGAIPSGDVVVDTFTGGPPFLCGTAGIGLATFCGTVSTGGCALHTNGADLPGGLDGDRSKQSWKNGWVRAIVERWVEGSPEQGFCTTPEQQQALEKQQQGSG
eukprot:2802294-Rhodomonas_salina.1